MFLSNPQHPQHLILFHLKSDIHKISGNDDVLQALIDHCCDAYEKERYLLASEKHMLLRVVPYLIYLMDSDDKDGFNVFKNKKLRMDRVLKIYKTCPVVPLYGDMRISVLWVLKQCVHWQDEMAQQWVTSKEGKLDRNYLLSYHRERIRKEYNEYTSQYISMFNSVKGAQAANRPVTSLLPDVFKHVLHGLKLLNAWTAKVIEQSAWKYDNPVSPEEYKEKGGKAVENQEYAKVVRYNYSNEELYALVDVIGMIKGLVCLLLFFGWSAHLLTDLIVERVQFGRPDDEA